MPSKPSAGALQGGSRSTDLTRNLLATRTALESHFNSFARREAEFRRQKLVLKDRELHVQRQAANADKRSSETDGLPQRSLSRAGARAVALGLQSLSGEEDSGLQRSRSGGHLGAGRARAGHGMGHSHSSPGLLGRHAEGGSPRRRLSWHGVDGAGSQTAEHPGTFCVTRFGATYPTSNHPAPHPGATTSRPHVRSSGTRSASPAGAAKAARLAVTVVAAEPEPALAHAHAGHEAPSVVADSPAPSLGGTLRLTSPDEEPPHEPMSPGAHSTWAGVGGAHASMPRFRPSSSAPASRWNLLTSVPDHREEDPLLAEELERFAAEDKAFSELGCYAGTREHRAKEKPKTIERLGDFMTLLGPRYKTMAKSQLFQRAEVGDLGSFQRRLNREKQEAQRGVKTGMAPQRVKMLGLVSTELDQPRRRRPQILSELLDDPDGAARAAWLSARAQEVERRARSANSLFAAGSGSGGEGAA